MYIRTIDTINDDGAHQYVLLQVRHATEGFSRNYSKWMKVACIDTLELEDFITTCKLLILPYIHYHNKQ